MSTARLFLVAAMVLPMLGACTSSPADGDRPVSFSVRCAPEENASDCLRTVSEMCGARGYDLFDAEGQPITIAELKYNKAEARCR